jgi:hypothetical protein
MTLRIDGRGDVELLGLCPSEDAEALLRHLCDHPKAAVDWRGCENAHTAVVQVLIAARANPKGPPASSFLAGMVAPLLRRS